MDKRKPTNQQMKEKLFYALISFSRQKDWSKVTVTELVEKSGMVRASFYRNFHSVEDIIQYGIDWAARRYHQGMPKGIEDYHGREMMEYRFRFYQERTSLVLVFHHANVNTALLDIITDCEIECYGDMPADSISRYELYYYAGAFYNMMVCWLESGMKETPEAMAEEFLRTTSIRMS